MFGFLKKKISDAIASFTKGSTPEPSTEESKKTEEVLQKEEKEKDLAFTEIEEVVQRAPKRVQQEIRKTENVLATEKKEAEQLVAEIISAETQSSQKQNEEKKKTKTEKGKEITEQKVKKEVKKEEKKQEQKYEKKQEKEKSETKEKKEEKEYDGVEKKEEEVVETVQKKGFFSRFTEKVTSAITTTTLTEEKFEELFWSLEMGLMESNVAVEVIEKIKQDLKQELVASTQKRRNLEEVVKSSLRKSVAELFREECDLVQQIRERAKRDSEKPFIIAFVGINGVGKTTTLAKLAKKLQDNGLTPVIAAADTFRAAAIEQLEEHATRLGIKIIKHDYGSDAAAVCFDAIAHAKAKGLKVVLIDTAGRSNINVNLMAELKKVIRVAHPDMTIFVGDAVTGNDAVEQAKKFNETVGIDGIILAKADVDEKGGGALSVSYVTHKPILFLGVGQRYEDLEKFSKDIILQNLGLV